MFRFPQPLVLSGVAFALLVAGCLAAWAAATDSSEAQTGSMQSCPSAGMWAIAVWDGADGTAAADALATCGEGSVAAAYSLNAQTGVWSRWFAANLGVSDLTSLDDTQGVLALGSATGPVATPTPAVTATPPPASLTEEGIAAVVKSVAGPEGTGLPGEPRVTVDPGGIIPIFVLVTVEEPNALAWSMLSLTDEDVDYVVRVLKALHEAYPDLQGSVLTDEVPIYFTVMVTDHKNYIPNWPIGAFARYCFLLTSNWYCIWPAMTGRYIAPYGIYEYQTIYDYADDDWHPAMSP